MPELLFSVQSQNSDGDWEEYVLSDSPEDAVKTAIEKNAWAMDAPLIVKWHRNFTTQPPKDPKG